MRSILRNPGSVLLAFAVMAAGATVVACATSSSGMDVTFDYDTGANFAALKSYSWMPPTGNAVGDELLVKRIKTTVDSQLQAKGPVPAEANPDFLIDVLPSCVDAHNPNRYPQPITAHEYLQERLREIKLI